MVYTTPTNRSTGDLITTAIWNADVVENMKQNTTEKVTTAGDVVYATGANAIARLGLAGKGGQFLRANAGETALEYAEVPTIIAADAFEWATKVANRYTANLGSEALLNNAVFGDLLDVGWGSSGSPAPPVPTTASTGDLDAADDFAPAFWQIYASGSYIVSPKVVGGWPLIEQIEFHTGIRPTKCTVRLVNAWESAGADAQDTTGVGIVADTDATLSAGGAGSCYMITRGATNFELWDGAAATDLGIPVDADFHNCDIEITFATATYRVLIDGVEVKAPAALAQDKWPMAVSAYHGTTGGTLFYVGCGVKYE